MVQGDFFARTPGSALTKLSGRRRRATPPLLVLAVALLLAGGVTAVTVAVTSSGPSPSVASDTPVQILQGAVGAARQAGSFRLVVSGPALISGGALTADVGRKQALLSFKTGPSAVEFEVGNGVTYVHDEGGALFGSVGTATNPRLRAALEGWIAVPSDAAEFSAASRYLTPQQLISNILALATPLSKVPASSTTPGTVAIRGTMPSTAFNTGNGAGDRATLVVSDTSPPYPISVSFTDAKGSGIYIFSRWGVPVVVPSTAGAITLSALERLIAESVPPTTVVPPSGVASGQPVPTGKVPAGSVTPVVTEPAPGGVVIDVHQAELVAQRLWTELVLARHDRDPAALAVVESGPALAVDRVICEAGCPPPPLYQHESTSVVLPRQRTWPALFFASASYQGSCELSPCDDSFVAVQPRAGAPWRISLVISWSGPALGSNEGPTGYDPSGYRTEEPAVDYLQQYATYLQVARSTGALPRSTWLGPGYFTSQSATRLYVPPSQYPLYGYSTRATYTVGPTPIYAFPAFDSQGDAYNLVCGTVDWTTTDTALRGRVIDQPFDRSTLGAALAPGVYSQVVSHGLHMTCIESSVTAPKQAYVLGDWYGQVSAGGTPAK